jgi:hypothetical protein
LTSSPAWEGRPTWSNNSKTIAFHAGMGQDTDIWTVPAAGGEATWLTGAPNFGDYDPNYSFNGHYVAYSSFSPNGQAARLWVAAYTYDPPAGTFGEGTHPYHFDFEWNAPDPGSWSGQGGEIDVSSGVDLYDGFALLRGPHELRGINTPEGLYCEDVAEINPGQSTRFLVGWLPDYGEISYMDAKAHFESITATAVWDDGSAELARHEIMPFNEGDWFNYVCAFTEAPPKMDLRVNYGHDWVESFYEGGHSVSIQVTTVRGMSRQQQRCSPNLEKNGEVRKASRLDQRTGFPARPTSNPMTGCTHKLTMARLRRCSLAISRARSGLIWTASRDD